MPYTDAELQRIAASVRSARIKKQLDKEPAARAAKVSSITWKRVEDAEGVRDASLSKILSSIGLTVESALNGEEPSIDQAQDYAPEFRKLPADMTHALRVEELWRLLTALADSPDGDPERQQKADDVLVSFADFLIEMLLTLNAGAAAKSLIQEMISRAFQILHLDKEMNDVVEIDTSAGASVEGGSPEEGGLQKPERRPPVGRPRGGLHVKGAGEDRADDADHGH